MSASRQLPARPNLEHLRNEAKQRLTELRQQDATAQLADAQRVVAREYGFASWRQLKAAVDRTERDRVFAAARDGDVDTVRRALDRGFHPGTIDESGRTLHQVAKTLRHTPVELLLRDYQERDDRPEDLKRTITAIHDAAGDGRLDDLRRLLDTHPGLIDARGVGPLGQTPLHRAARHDRTECVRLLIAHGADVNVRDYGDNASALHVAAGYAGSEVIRMLVDAGADVIGGGDDHQVGVLGWATCLERVREDVAAYLLGAGAMLTLWSAIALDRADDVRAFIARDPSLLTARMSRNEYRRTPLHHAAARNRPAMLRLLIELGADVDATDETGATALTTGATSGADASVLATLEQAGATLDLLSAVSLGRYDVAERMVRDDPDRLGPDGRDTIALHLLVAKRNTVGARWLIEHGVDVSARRVLWDCNSTALHVATEHGALELARMLLDAGADPNIRDDKYEATVLGWAEYCERPEIGKLVRERGGVM